MTTSLKQTLIDKIQLIEDESLLTLLNSEVNYFTQKNVTDITDSLSKEDFEELSNLMKEPFGENTVSLDEYKKATARWRTK
ncbi:MAG: hypothetical protein QM541_08395 [Flavobacterium sp.]|nr:hypothetical protein [Flavobacterium sp.]